MARVFSEIIQKLYIISGALINNRKSAVFGWNVDQFKVEKISQILGFEGYAS